VFLSNVVIVLPDSASDDKAPDQLICYWDFNAGVESLVGAGVFGAMRNSLTGPFGKVGGTRKDSAEAITKVINPVTSANPPSRIHYLQPPNPGALQPPIVHYDDHFRERLAKNCTLLHKFLEYAFSARFEPNGAFSIEP